MWRPGDPIPEFTAPTAHNPRYAFHTTAGRYVVLSFLGSAANEEVGQVVRFVEARRASFDDQQLCFFGVSADPADEELGRLRTLIPGIRYLRDPELALSKRFGALAPPQRLRIRCAARTGRNARTDPVLPGPARGPCGEARLPVRDHAHRALPGRPVQQRQRRLLPSAQGHPPPGTAHRRFACTINLNAEDYEGGELRFPEFGPRTYRAPTGGAVIFSCSLLHEATPVTLGARYAFLPFFYDEAAARQREANRHSLTGEVFDRAKGQDDYASRTS